MDQAYRDVDIDFGEARAMGNALLQKLNAMREVDPIYFSEKNGGNWIVTGHKQVVEGFRGDLPLSAIRLPGLVVGAIPEAERMTRIPYLMTSTPQWIINTDPPAQARLRKLMMKAFSRQVVETIRPHAKQYIAEALDEAGAMGELDFVSVVARKIPARVILRMMGLSDALIPRLHHWSIALNAALGGINMPAEVLEEGERVALEMRGHFMPEIEKRRQHPTDDFVSALVTAHDEGDRLSEEEMLGICYTALIAGHDTTANTLALGAAALAQHRQARDFIRNHPEKTADAVMELMRYIAMSTMMPRIVKEDFIWDGHEMKRGQFVFLMMAGANRDPRVFLDAEKIDMTRPQDANMAFAPGLHFCIGHLLAKMQLGEFFPEMLRRFEPELLDERLDFGLSISFRGVETLNIRLHPRGQDAAHHAAE
ncbi:MAG TPA: cytochrome P450 [Rhizomicrobium sp.]|nr:cytochrome P450 [Rhizomicrobium sp.]